MQRAVQMAGNRAGEIVEVSYEVFQRCELQGTMRKILGSDQIVKNDETGREYVVKQGVPSTEAPRRETLHVNRPKSARTRA